MKMKFTTREIYIIIAGLMVLSAIIVVGIGYKQQGKTAKEGEEAAAPAQSAISQLKPNPDETSKETIGRLGKKEIGTYRVTATEEGYSPWKLIAKEGTVIRIEFTSQGGTYDWYIPELGYSTLSKDNETNYLRFLAPKEGVYRITCKDLCPGNKLVGSLIVTPE